MTKTELMKHLKNLKGFDLFASQTPCRVANEIIKRLATAKDISEPTRSTLIAQYVKDLTDNETTLKTSQNVNINSNLGNAETLQRVSRGTGSRL